MWSGHLGLGPASGRVMTMPNLVRGIKGFSGRYQFLQARHCPPEKCDKHWSSRLWANQKKEALISEYQYP